MDTKAIIKELIRQRNQLDAAIAALTQGDDTTKAPASVTPTERPAKKRTMSPAGRRRIAEAAKKRWAAVKAAKGTR